MNTYMATINASTLTPPAVIAAWRADDWATADGLPAHEWLSRYWQARISVSVPDDVRDAASRYGEEAHGALVELAHALATEGITEAVDYIADYRQMGDLLPDDQSLTRMMIEILLDWSKWTSRVNIDDARAESWLRSLLS